MKFLFKSLFVLLVAPLCFGGVNDPVADFIRYEISSNNLYQSDDFLKILADLNGDGVDDVFLSTTSKERASGKGARSWDVYLSQPGGDYEVVGDLTATGFLRSSIIMASKPKLVQLDDVGGRFSFVSYFPQNAKQGALVATYISESGEVNNHSFGTLSIRKEDGSQEDQKLRNRVLAASIEPAVQRISAIDVLSSEQLSLLKSFEDTFWAKHYSSPDPNDPSVELVYESRTNELVGSKKRFEEFVPIEKVVSLEKLRAKELTKSSPEPIGTVLSKKASSSDQVSIAVVDQGETKREYLLVFLIVGFMIFIAILFVWKRFKK